MAKVSPYSMLNMYQSSPTKDEKDLSKSLVAGEYGAPAGEPRRGGRGRGGRAALWAALGALALWALALTVARELQLAAVRRELDQLSANMLAVSASVRQLHDKVLAHNKLLDEFNLLEDSLYSDDERAAGSEAGPGGAGAGTGAGDLAAVADLGDDTEDDEDDEDLYDTSYEPSGDMYWDYDKRRDKIGKTNMVKLEPEEFGGQVLALGPDRASSLRQIRQRLNENPESPDLAGIVMEASSVKSKTASTPAGAERGTDGAERARRSVLGDSAADSLDFRVPRTYLPEEREAHSKGQAEPHWRLLAAPARRARNSDDEVPQRPFIAAHFHGNTSHLNPDIHEHYKGNGLVRLKHGAHHDVWFPSPWTLASRDRPTLTHSGHVHVHHTGVYLVYVQIYYLDSHDVISWVLHRTNADTEGRDTLLQCAQSSHGSRAERPNSCFSASALLLRRGDRLAVRNTGGDRHSVMLPEKSFVGLVQLADGMEPEEL